MSDPQSHLFKKQEEWILNPGNMRLSTHVCSKKEHRSPPVQAAATLRANAHQQRRHPCHLYPTISIGTENSSASRFRIQPGNSSVLAAARYSNQWVLKYSLRSQPLKLSMNQSRLAPPARCAPQLLRHPFQAGRHMRDHESHSDSQGRRLRSPPLNSPLSSSCTRLRGIRTALQRVFRLTREDRDLETPSERAPRRQTSAPRSPPRL